MAKAKILYSCNQCGAEAPKWPSHKNKMILINNFGAVERRGASVRGLPDLGSTGAGTSPNARCNP